MASDGARWLAPGAALLGLVIALGGALLGGATRLSTAPSEAIAVADDVIISREDYARALSALEADKRSPLTEADRALALQRLIEEELLVRRGIALDLAATDPTVRRALAQAMAQFASAEAMNRPNPDDATLQKFLSERPMLLNQKSDMRVRLALMPATAADRIGAFGAALRAGANFDDAAKAANAEPADVPDAVLSPADLTARAGPSVRAAAAALQPGEAAGPITLGEQVGFVLLVERRDPPARDFASLRPAVLEAWRQDQEARALDAYLADLRRQAKIIYAPDAPKAAK
jgi:parvulin-like peptidyl-prolyl isomerase